MSKSSAQKSISGVSIPKKPEGPPPFDPQKYATKNLTVDDVQKLKECFDVFDYDKSGNVSAE
jgi:Ca2+-binding EF-hand superfamily protein